MVQSFHILTPLMLEPCRSRYAVLNVNVWCLSQMLSPFRGVALSSAFYTRTEGLS